MTDLVTASATTLAVSGGGMASIVFEAQGQAQVGPIDLADATLGLTIKSANNVGYQVASNAKQIILLGLCKIQSRFLWWDDVFQPLSRGLSHISLYTAIEDSEKVNTEESKEALYFGQMK